MCTQHTIAFKQQQLQIAAKETDKGILNVSFQHIFVSFCHYIIICLQARGISCNQEHTTIQQNRGRRTF
jgi:hypothetical protein